MFSLLHKNRLLTAGLTGGAALWIASSGTFVAPASGAARAPLSPVASVANTGHARAATAPSARTRAATTARASYTRLPLGFESVAGHGPDGVRFLARGNGYAVYLTPREAALVLGDVAPVSRAAHNSHPTNSAVLRFHLLGANPRARVTGAARQSGTVNYFGGTDQRAWQRGVPTYGQVDYSGIYRGVDLRYYGTQNRLEYDFRVAAHADPAQIRQGVGGARALRLDANGDLSLAVAGGRALRWARPVAYQIARDGRRVGVDVRYQLLGHDAFGFAPGRYDRARPLVIDPVLSYSTFFGYNDAVTGVALDSSGNTYIAGYTNAAIITSTQMLQLAHAPGLTPDAFVAKLSADNHQLVYSTFVGGGGQDVATGIAIDGQGDAYVAGYTNSGLVATQPPFPVTDHAFQKVNHGGNDAFIFKLSPNGRALLYSTYLGGSTDNADTVGDDLATGVAVDRGGVAYVTGYTYAYNFPLKNPLQGSLGYGKGTLGTQVDAFVTKLNPSGSGLIYSTYLGGSGSDSAVGIAVDRAGEAYVTGQTNSPDFPTPKHALQAQLYGTDYNAFVAKLNAAGNSLVYATYLGRTAADKAHGIAVDSAGDAYIVGETNGGIPRTVGVAQPTSGGGIDAFVAKLDPRGVLRYSTYLGGIGDDIGYAIALDPAGDAYVTGSTASAAFNTPVFPLKGALQGDLGGNRGGFGMLDAFVAKVNSCGSALLYSSYLGGTFVDSGQAIAVDYHGDAYIGGQTLSPNFPISRAVRGGSTYAPPTSNAFVAKISGSPGSAPGACPLALTLDAAPQVSGTGALTVTVHTTPFAQVAVTLDVRNAVPPPPAVKGAKGPKAPKLGALLYQKTVHGMADSYGLYQGVLRLKYVTAAPVAAGVRVQARSGRTSAASTVPIQVTP